MIETGGAVSTTLAALLCFPSQPVTPMVAGLSVLELLSMTRPSPDIRTAQVRGATLSGPTATLVGVRATIESGQRGFEIPGVAGYVTWPLRDRVRAAILNSGMAWPTAGISVELSPSARFRHGVGLDLAIAVAILTADGTVLSATGMAPVFAAELRLDGQLRPVRNIMPVLEAASKSARPATAVIAPGNQGDADAVSWSAVATIADLRLVAAWLSENGAGDGNSRPGSAPVRTGPEANDQATPGDTNAATAVVSTRVHWKPRERDGDDQERSIPAE